MAKRFLPYMVKNYEKPHNQLFRLKSTSNLAFDKYFSSAFGT